MSEAKHLVAVIGAGPAGLYAARLLALSGADVVLFNRDIKPGGLAEYGIFFDKYKMKSGLRKQFKKILDDDHIDYFGNVTVGRGADFTLDQIRAMGFDAILVTVGAQGTKWLGLPGEELTGVYHAKDLVYHYNKLPPFSEEQYAIGKSVAIIGAGNVMLDIASWCIRYLKVDEVVSIVRRDPAAVKFTKKEMSIIFENLDIAALDAEIERTRPIMEAVGNDPEAAREFILSAEQRAYPKLSDTRFRFEFLAQPQRIVGDGNGRVSGLEVEDTTLVLRSGGRTSAVGTGNTRIVDVDTVVFAIGDKVDNEFGLPIEWNEYVKSKTPHFPIDDMSYEAFDPVTGQTIDGVFVAGWARSASDGLVGAARKDGENGAKALLAYLETREAGSERSATAETVREAVHANVPNVVDKVALDKLEADEDARAVADGLEEYKYSTIADMLAVIAR